MFEISSFEFNKNEFLTHTVSFGVVFAFSRGLRYFFSKDVGPGLDLEVPHLGILGLEFEIVLSYLKSTSLNLCNYSILQNNRNV